MILRAPMALGAAALLTTSLFYGMQLLITMGDVPVMTEEPPRIFDTRIPERRIEPIRETPPVKKVEQVPPPVLDKPTFKPTGPSSAITAELSPLPTTTGPIGVFHGSRQAQPIFRMEPQFTNITQPEYITLSFDVGRTGAVIKDSIVVLEASSSRLSRPAKRAVQRWKYQPKLVEGEAVIQRDLRIVFNVQPAE